MKAKLYTVWWYKTSICLTAISIRPSVFHRPARLAVEELSVWQLVMIWSGRLRVNVGDVFTVCICIAGV